MRNRSRTQSGITLASILTLGVITGVAMFGTINLIVPATQRLNMERDRDLSRCSAEAGLDYAIQQFNKPSTRSSMLSATSCTIPSSVMADYNASKSPKTRFSGSITIANVRPPCTTYTSSQFGVTAYPSYLYDVTVDDTNAQSSLYNSSGSISNNMWRVLTSQVSNGLVSWTVRVIIKPNIVSSSTSSSTPIYSYSAFGSTGVTASGNAVFDSYDSGINPHPATFDTLNSTGKAAGTPGYGDVSTNGNSSISGNVVIGGNMDSYGINNTNTASGGAKVFGTVEGINNSGFPTAQSFNTNPTSPWTVPTVPATPSNPTALPGGGSTISLSGNSTLTLPAGNYVVSSVSISGNGQLVVNNANGPVNIWVAQNSSSGISISGNGVSNSSGIPANFNIFYQGSKSTTLSGNGTFTGTILAPSSAISVSGNGTIYGGVVGSSLTSTGNGSFHYDRALMRNSQLTYSTQVTSSTLGYWTAVSWHEFNPNSPY